MADVIGEERLRHDLFRNWPYSLRFELSGSGSYVQMFARALERTLAVARFVFPEGNPVDVVARFYQREAQTAGPPTGLVALADCGFELPAEHTRREHTFREREVPPGGGERRLYEYTYRFRGRIGDANTLAVIRAILGGEIGIRPCAGVSGYFVAADEGVVLHPYDDRGMDVVADDPGTLPAIGRHFRDWLLGCRPEGLV
jgi:Domain of unknown function (DUF3885)